MSSQVRDDPHRQYGWEEGRCNCENKVLPVHSVKACRGNRGLAPLFLNLCTGWGWVVNFTLRPHYLLGI